jgi:hypothetical protein
MRRIAWGLGILEADMDRWKRDSEPFDQHPTRIGEYRNENHLAQKCFVD